MSTTRSAQMPWKRKVNTQKNTPTFQRGKVGRSQNTPHRFLVPLVSLLYISPAFPLLTPLRRKTQTRSTPQKTPPGGDGGRINHSNPAPSSIGVVRSRRKGDASRTVTRSRRMGPGPAWERVRRALATRLCMRFPARHVAIVDELDYVETPDPAPAAEVGEEERENSPAVVSPGPVSAQSLSSSGSLSHAVRISFAPLFHLCVSVGCPWCVICVIHVTSFRRIVLPM
jgi:hypothetical protein